MKLFHIDGDARKIAVHICTTSAHAFPGGESYEAHDIQGALGLTPELLTSGVAVLIRLGYVRAQRDGDHGYPERMRPTWKLYFDFDPEVKGWDPGQDAFTVMSELSKRAGEATLRDLASALAWPARRLNPACAELVTRGHVQTSDTNPPAPYAFSWIRV